MLLAGCADVGCVIAVLTAFVPLICPITICPIGVALALPIYKAAIVDVRRRLLPFDARIRHPIRHPDFVSIPIDFEPATETADYQHSCTGSRICYDGTFEAVGSSQIRIVSDADVIGLR